MAANDKPTLSGYEVLVCVTGGIACYKSADLVSKFVQAGAGVNVATTDSSTKFVTPLTFQTLTRRQVYTTMWQGTEDFQSGHLSLTEQADIMVVAPATANFIAKTASGIADDLVTALALSAHGECPILIAPAMNTRMWEAPPTQANIERLKGWGIHVIGPAEGFLACRTVGPGRMVEPADILARATEMLLKNPPKRRKQ